MIKKFNDFDAFEKAVRAKHIASDLENLRSLDILFYETYKDHMILSVPGLNMMPNQILVLSSRYNYAYVEGAKIPTRVKISKLKHSKYMESTLLAYEVLAGVVAVYGEQYRKIARKIEQLHDYPDIDEVEIVGKQVRIVSDVMEDVLQLVLEAEDEEFKYLNPDVIPYEFDILVARTRHIVDRIRNLKREINILRTKCELIEARKLNKRIELLTKIMAILTIVSLIISVPNTVATFFGIPSVAETVEIQMMVWVILISSVLAVLLSYLYVRGVI